jgi:hypothetical protein
VPVLALHRDGKRTAEDGLVVKRSDEDGLVVKKRSSNS